MTARLLSSGFNFATTGRHIPSCGECRCHCWCGRRREKIRNGRKYKRLMACASDEAIILDAYNTYTVRTVYIQYSLFRDIKVKRVTNGGQPKSRQDNLELESPKMSH